MSMTLDEQIAILVAKKAGKTIQIRQRGSHADWTGDAYEFSFGIYDYRIKPEPPKPRMWVIPEFRVFSGTAEQARAYYGPNVRLITVREVLPDEA